MILDVDWVPDKGGEAKVAMSSFEGLTPLVPHAGRHLRHRTQRYPPPDVAAQLRLASR
jgi:hypothetical protein